MSRHSDPRHTANDVSIHRCSDIEALWHVAQWRCAPPEYGRLLQQINGVVFPAAADSFLQDPQMAIYPVCWGHMSDSMKAKFSRGTYINYKARLRDSVSVQCAMARGGATVLKVGDKFCERREQKIFDPPTFWPVGDKILLRYLSQPNSYVCFVAD